MWSFCPACAAEFETFQILAFNYGYKWKGSLNQFVQWESVPLLIIDPNKKEIDYAFSETDFQLPVTAGIFNALNTLKSPAEEEEVLGMENGNFVLFTDGHVETKHSMSLSKEAFDQIIDSRESYTGRPSRQFPLVRFNYQDVGDVRYQERKVFVVRNSIGGFWGFDCGDNYKCKEFTNRRIDGRPVFLELGKPGEKDLPPFKG
jgi:hypothetical protein